jgi:uncharacterized protein YdaU (DUF1376 family)
MKERAPAFQFYPRQFAGDDRVMGMDLEAIGAHILLMCAAAASPEQCRIDADEYAIRMRLRNPSNEAWERIKKQLLAGAWKISSDGKWWIQSGLERTFQKQKEFSERQRKKANQKWGKDDAEPLPDSGPIAAGALPDGMPTGCFSFSSSSSNLKPTRGNSAQCQTDAGGVLEEFTSTSVAQIACQENGWSGRLMLCALRDAIRFQAKQMPQSNLEEVSDWLIQSYRSHRAARGNFAVGAQKYFSEGLYQSSERSTVMTKSILTDNPATRALAQMEGD